MIFGPKRKKDKEPDTKISEEEFKKEFRPLLVAMCKDCMSKAKSLQSKYRNIEDIKYVKKFLNLDDDYIEPGELKVQIYGQGYYFFDILIIDGSQEARMTEAAGKYLEEVRDYLYKKYKDKFIKDEEELIDISTGDGDEGCIYIEFKKSKLDFDVSKVSYSNIKESYSVFDNLRIL